MIFKLTMSLMQDPFSKEWCASILLTCLPSEDLGSGASPKEYVRKFHNKTRAEALAEGFRFVHEATLG